MLLGVAPLNIPCLDAFTFCLLLQQWLHYDF